MSHAPVVIEKIVQASVKKVWKALTDKDQMKEWYFILDEFKPEVGFTFMFTGKGQKGESYTHICKITEVIPFKKLQYSWQYDNYDGFSLVSFELFEEGHATRVVVTHEGLESFPQNNADFAKESFVMGWTEIITVSLYQYVENKN